MSETAITAKLMEWRAAGDAAEVAEKGSGEDAKESTKQSLTKQSLTKQSLTKQSPTKQSPTNDDATALEHDDVIVIDSKSALNTTDSRRALNTADTVESPGGARGGALGGDPPNKATRTKKIHQAPRKLDTDSPDTYNFCDPDDPGGGNPFSGVCDPIVLSGDPDSLYVKSPARGRAVLTPVKRNAKRRKPFLKIVPNAAEVVETEEGLTPRKQGLPPTETADETVTETVETFPASPDPDVSSLPPARLEFHAALKAIGFDPKTYWRSYADMHRAVLYGDRSARDRIEFSPVGALLATHFSFATSFPWTKASTRRVMTNEILPGMVRAFPNHHVPPLRLPILVLRRDYYDQKGLLRPEGRIPSDCYHDCLLVPIPHTQHDRLTLFSSQSGDVHSRRVWLAVDAAIELDCRVRGFNRLGKRLWVRRARPVGRGDAGGG